MSAVADAATEGPAGGIGRQALALLRDVASVGRARLAAVLALAALGGLAQGAGLLVLVPLLKSLGVGEPGGLSLEPALGLYVLAVAAAALVIQARAVAAADLRATFVDRLRRALHAAVLQADWPFLQRLRASELSHALTADVAHAAVGVDYLLRLAAAAIELPLLAVVALRLSPVLTVAAALVALLVVWAARPLTNRTFALGRLQRAASRQVSAVLVDDLAGLRVIKSFGLERDRGAAFEGRLAELRGRQAEHQRMLAVRRGLAQAAAAAAVAVGISLAVHGLGLALADVLVFAIAFARLGQTALRLEEGWRTLAYSLPGYQAARDLLARCEAAGEPLAARPEPIPAVAAAAALRLSGVTVRWLRERPAALAAVDAEIPRGRITALTGPSGAGKSTLADVLLGLAIPDAGHLLIDGVPLDAAGRRAWRARTAYVPQDPFLFHDTIRMNLRAADPAATDTALWAALDRASAGFVRALPEGLDTVVGDRASRFSGGERQRLALARALLRRPALLVVDEATNALDAAHERHVLDTLVALREQTTVVVISHRPETLAIADGVIALDGGRIA